MKRLNEAKWGADGAGVGKSLKLSLACVAVALMLGACGGGGGNDPEVDASGPKVAGTVAGLTASGLVLTNGTDTVTVPANATSFELPAGGTLAVAHQPLGFSQVCEVSGTASSPSVSCGAAAAKVSWLAGWGNSLQSNAPAIMGPDGRVYFVSNTAVYSALPSGEGGYRVLAGSTMETGDADGVGAAARFNAPQDMVMDADGNFYVLDQGSTGAYSIRKVTPAGGVSTIASGFGGANPSFGTMVLGPNNQIYLLSYEQDNTQSVQRLKANGQLEVVFNTGAMSGTVPNSPYMSAMAVGSDGALYWADNNNHGIYKLAPGAANPVLLAGSGSGEGCLNGACTDGVGQNARVDYVQAITVNSQGVVFALDYSGALLRRISASGEVKTIVGDRANPVSNNVDGTGAAASIFAYRMSWSADGSVLYLSQGYASDIRVVRNLSADAADASTALPNSATVTQQPSAVGSLLLQAAWAVASDAVGNVYVNEARFDPNTFEKMGSYIRKISPQGVVSTVGATAAILQQNSGDLKIGSDGQIYVAGPCSIERMAPDGSLSTLAGAPTQTRCSAASVDGPAGTATVQNIVALAPGAAGDVYFTEQGKVRHVTRDGAIATLTLVDGNGATFTPGPGITVDSQGKLYVANASYSQVFKVTVQGTQGTVALVAGTGGTVSGAGADGDALTQATFATAYGLTADTAGNVYVMDYSRGSFVARLRQITPSGQVHTLAGGGGNRELVDGVGASARFGLVVAGGIAATPGGEVYLVDSGFLRKVEAVKAPSTLATTE
jgi:sugar lactone lactonase YvrE